MNSEKNLHFLPAKLSTKPAKILDLDDKPSPDKWITSGIFYISGSKMRYVYPAHLCHLVSFIPKGSKTLSRNFITNWPDTFDISLKGNPSLQ
jgi:hypothetical protein